MKFLKVPMKFLKVLEVLTKVLEVPTKFLPRLKDLPKVLVVTHQCLLTTVNTFVIKTLITCA